MKTFIILAVCLAAVSAKVTIVRRTMPNVDITADEKKTLKQCLKDHNIDPDIMSESAEPSAVNPISLLSEADIGCVSACVSVALKYIKPDGTLDFDQLFVGGEKDPEAKWARNVVGTIQEACRAAAGDNNCRFFQCMNKIDLEKLKVSASDTE